MVILDSRYTHLIDIHSTLLYHYRLHSRATA